MIFQELSFILLCVACDFLDSGKGLDWAIELKRPCLSLVSYDLLDGVLSCEIMALKGASQVMLMKPWRRYVGGSCLF